MIDIVIRVQQSDNGTLAGGLLIRTTDDTQTELDGANVILDRIKPVLQHVMYEAGAEWPAQGGEQ